MPMHSILQEKVLLLEIGIFLIALFGLVYSF